MSYTDIFSNHIFDRNFFEHEILQILPEIEAPELKFSQLEAIRKNVMAGGPEANLDLAFTAPLLNVLGWPYRYQEKFKFHGNKKIPDFILFSSEKGREDFLAAPKDDKPLKLIASVWEDKAANVALDNGKTDSDNPYFQLMEYLMPLRLPFGFLSNGHEIWYVDNSDIFSEKRYLAMNFDRLVETRNIGALRIFMGIFGHAAHFPPEGEESAARRVASESLRRRNQSEEELRNVIYGLNGRDSFFERCGAFLYKAQKKRDTSMLAELYKNCLYFTFRLIFIAFFEDKHRHILEKHGGYQSIALSRLYRRVKKLVPQGSRDGYEAWNDLQTLFRTLDEGNSNLDIPLFNGGLFARHIAWMLDQPKVMTNAEVLLLLDMLYGESGGYVRDFSSLSTIQLGRIYESLLEFEFRVAEENLYYFSWREKARGRMETIDGYFDTEDYRNMKNSAKGEIVSPVVEYRKDEVYLVGGKNSRKRSASYFTPQSLSRPLVKAALDDAVAKLGENGSLLDLKILDNACGSGHMLVEALQYLTQLALGRLDKDSKLKPVLEDEKKRVDETLDGLGLLDLGIKVDELAILKRILLKRAIYGVDLQPFAVELTKLSLWIETFVFGTPLSFIEHHVKTGNSLIGATLDRVKKSLAVNSQTNLMDLSITDSFQALGGIFQKLSALQDTTAADIAASKNIFQREIKPQLEEIGNYFDLLNSADMLLAESAADRKLADEPPPAGADPGGEWKSACRKSAEEKKKDGNAFIRQYGMYAQELRNRLRTWQDTETLIRAMRKKYAFFNWQLEFPEVFATPENSGFKVILGNPPWDKTKFADPDFFAQYRSNYRQLPNSGKRHAAAELLAKPYIYERYKKQAAGIFAMNEYYREHFPISRGEGDGNLFRFFVENNLSLLARGGTLNYVIPTALWLDEGSTELRRRIIDAYWLRDFYGFENREGLFPDVDARYKFGLMRVERPAAGMPAAQKKANTMFMLRSPAELEDRNRRFAYSMEDIAITSPAWHALMEVRTRRELDIMRKIHSSGCQCLDPGWIDFRNELHATADKKIFHERYRDGEIPLYKGACIWQFNSQYWNQAGADNRNEYWLDPDEFDAHLRTRERRRLVDDLYPLIKGAQIKGRMRSVLDFLGLKKEAELDQFLVPDRLYPRLAFRAIARDTDERTMIASVIPANAGTQNSLWVSVPKRYVLDGKSVTVQAADPFALFYCQAFFNSLVFDWIMRCSIQINVNKTYLWRVPMPQPQPGEIAANPDFLKLARNSLRLSAFYNEKAFLPMFAQFGLHEGDRVTGDKMANMARRENDLLIARLYGLTHSDMRIMLGSFTRMNYLAPGYGAALLEMLEK